MAQRDRMVGDGTDSDRRPQSGPLPVIVARATDDAARPVGAESAWRRPAAYGPRLAPTLEPSWTVAERAAFRAFANCYLREIDAGRFVARDGPAPSFIEWRLTGQRRRLRAALAYRSLCGAHEFGLVQAADFGDGRFRSISWLTGIQLMIAEASERNGGALAGSANSAALLSRVIQSIRAIDANLTRTRTTVPGHDFLATEQSLVYGHWLHPTPKSMEGITPWQREVYAPEAGGRFQLVAFAVDRHHVREDHAYGPKPTEIAARLAGDDLARCGLGDKEAILLMHPLQAEYLQLSPHVAAARRDGILRLLGPVGPDFFATSSMRTVCSADAGYQLKFSLPVQITNSVRRNGLEEMKAGVAMARWLKRQGALAEAGGLSFLPDPAWVTVELPGQTDTGFETIYRETVAPDAEPPVMVAALTAAPVRPRPSMLKGLIARLAARDGATPQATAARWFDAYLKASVEPVIRFFDRTGIALEAHQQNCLLRLVDGWPDGLVYRDNQGFYLSESERPALSTNFPEARGIDGLFFREEEIVGRLTYYLLVNQVFSVIARLGEDGLLPEDAAIGQLRQTLQTLAGRTSRGGRRFCDTALAAPDLVLKANLGLRLADTDELASPTGAGVYTRWPNPLIAPGPSRPQRLAS